eukprot:scaffold119854_cov69-Phaeocystis_antarctica.AAC.4
MTPPRDSPPEPWGLKSDVHCAAVYSAWTRSNGWSTRLSYESMPNSVMTKGLPLLFCLNCANQSFGYAFVAAQ